VVRLDVGGTPLNTSLATVMEGARQGSEVFECLCAQVGAEARLVCNSALVTQAHGFPEAFAHPAGPLPS